MSEVGQPTDARSETEFTSADTTADRLATEPLLMSIGDCATSRAIVALLNHHPYPLTPSQIASAGGIDRTTWYDINDRLLECGLVVERGERGSSTLYGLAEDERLDALRTLRGKSGKVLREQRDLAVSDGE